MYVLSAKLCFVPVGSHGKAPAHAALSANNTTVQMQKGVASNCYVAAQAEARVLIHTEQTVRLDGALKLVKGCAPSGFGEHQSLARRFDLQLLCSERRL